MGPQPGVDTSAMGFYQSKKRTIQNNFAEDFYSNFQMVEHYGINPSMLSMKFADDDHSPEIASDSPLYKRIEIPKTPVDVESDEIMKFNEHV